MKTNITLGKIIAIIGTILCAAGYTLKNDILTLTGYVLVAIGTLLMSVLSIK